MLTETDNNRYAGMFLYWAPKYPYRIITSLTFSLDRSLTFRPQDSWKMRETIDGDLQFCFRNLEDMVLFKIMVLV